MTSPPKAYSYIRFSKPEQLKGDSLRRQLEASKAYADKHGLTLDESLKPDKGLSAYHGMHRIKGALGQFLTKIDAGAIPEGSVLIVESLDRLSREAVLDALSQFTAIISRGVKIVTLADGQAYSRESIDANVGQLIISLTIMSRAHEESQIKAMRSKASWENKRKHATSRKLTAKGPNWLKLNKDKQRFEPIPDRAKLLKRIYGMRLDGLGGWSIAKKLNGEGIKPWQSKLGWSRSTIHRLLRDKAVTGWYQPHKNEGRKRLPIGDSIPDYYPAVIDQDTFYRVQNLLDGSRNKGGRKQFNINLFPHVAKCGYCGAPMQILDKGQGKRYLQCNRVLRNIDGCPGNHNGYGKSSLPYNDFEDAFLKLCGSLNVAEVMPHDDEQAKKIKALNRQIKAIDGQLADVTKAKANADKLLAIADDEATLKHVASKLKDTLAQETGLTEQRLKTVEDLQKAESATKDTSRQLKEVKELIDHMATASVKKRSEIRGRLKSHIQQLVKFIFIFCNGKQHKVLEAYPWVSRYKDTFDKEIIQRQTGRDQRAFGIFFAAGGFREIIWQDGEYQVGVSLKDKLEEQKFMDEVEAGQ